MGEYVGSSVYAELNLARGIGGDCESGLNQDGLEGYYRQFKDPPRLKTAWLTEQQTRIYLFFKDEKQHISYLVRKWCTESFLVL